MRGQYLKQEALSKTVIATVNAKRKESNALNLTKP